MDENTQNLYRKSTTSAQFYLLTERDFEKIDGLTNLLNIAVSEIINRRLINSDGRGETDAQEAFNNACYDAIEGKKFGPD